MAEKAIFFTTGGAGDGAATYTEGEWTALWRELLCYDKAQEGVCIASAEYPTPLAVTAGAGKVTVSPGRAVCYGYMYWNTAPVDVAIPTPSAATRIDRIVLRALYASGVRTVRITRIAGVEGGGAPAIVQDPGQTTWDIKLAQVAVTTGGGITVTDERQWLHPNWRVATRNLDDGVLSADAAGRAKMADGFITAEKLASGLDAGALGFIAYKLKNLLWKTVYVGTNWAMPAASMEYTDVNGMSVTVSPTAAVDVLAWWSSYVTGGVGGTIDFRLVVDAVDCEEWSIDGMADITGAGVVPLQGHWMFENLGAGAHTIKVRIRHTQEPSAQYVGRRRLSVLLLPR